MERDCHILTPSFSDYSSTSSSFCWAAQPGSWGPKPSVWRWFSNRGQLRLELNCLELQLTQAVCGTWLYNCLTSTCFLWAYASAPNSTTFTGQGDIPIPSTGCTCFLIDGSVEGQYVTHEEICILRFIYLFRSYIRLCFLLVAFVREHIECNKCKEIYIESTHTFNTRISLHESNIKIT